jgi:hypothetical protein
MEGTMDADTLIADYLGRLRAASWPLATGRREELASEVAEHIDAALGDAGVRDEATVRNVLDRLGPPESSAAAEVGDGPAAQIPPPPAGAPAVAVPPARIAGPVEVAALLVFAFGGIVPFVGVPFGYALTFLSPRWTTRERIVAGVVAFGCAAVLGAIPTMTAGGGMPSISPLPAALILMSICGPFGAIYLLAVLVSRRGAIAPAPATAQAGGPSGMLLALILACSVLAILLVVSMLAVLGAGVNTIQP